MTHTDTSGYKSVLKYYHRRSDPQLFDLIDGLRKYCPSKQVLLVQNFVTDEFLARWFDTELDEVGRRWGYGVSWLTWDRPPPPQTTGRVLTEVQTGHLQVTWQN